MDIRDLLRNMPTPGGLQGETTVLAFNGEGEILSAFTRSRQDQKWRKTSPRADAKSPRPCTVLLPPGVAALRKSPVPKADEKDAEAVLRAEAERTLLRNPELGCDEIRMLSLERGVVGVMAWLPSELPYLCFERAVEQGFAPKAVMVPEFNLDASGSALLISCANAATRLCCIHERTPVAWQSLPKGGPDLRAGLEAVLGEAGAMGIPAPDKVFVWHDDGTADRAEAAVLSLLPDARLHRLEGVEGLLPNLRLHRESLFSRGKTAFRPCLHKWESTPLASKDILRLAVPVVSAVLGCLLMFMAVVHLYDKEAEALDKRASQLKILAARSDEATSRIRTYGDHKRNILRYTTGKASAFTMFRSLAKAVPQEVKVTNLRLARSGEVTLTGDAMTEVSLISFLTNLNTSRNFDNAALDSMTREKNSKTVKFVITLDYSPWKKFFQQESEYER